MDPKSFNIGAHYLGEFIEDASIPNVAPEEPIDNCDLMKPLQSSTPGPAPGSAIDRLSREPEATGSKDDDRAA